MKRTVLLAAVALAACGKPPAGTARNGSDTAPINSSGAIEAPAPAASATPSAFAGHWLGVEGMYLDVTDRSGGKYVLEMQYDLDHKQTVAGTGAGDGITFDRDGKTLTLNPGDGDATGLKYLAGKKDCLIVMPGEGYCRD